MRLIIFSKLLLVLCLFGLTIFLDSCSEKVVGPDKPKPTDSISVPTDCPPWQMYKRIGSNDLNFKAIQPWFQAVTSGPNDQAESFSSVEIKPLTAKLIEISADNQEKVIAYLSDEYGETPERALITNEGGLFSRWYIDNTFEPLVNSVYNYQNNSLKILVGRYPKRVSHWWFNSHGKYPKQDNCSYDVEIEVSINGNACFQIAADFYKTTASDYPDNKEAGHSDWFGDTNGWRKIRFRVCQFQ
jgi:hypothetical protein